MTGGRRGRCKSRIPMDAERVRREKGVFMSETKTKKSFLDKMLDGIERVGNKLPDPITMFLGLAVIVVATCLQIQLQER